MTTSNKKPLKILLVEDEPIPMLIHQKMLAMLGYTFDIAKDGRCAIKLSVNDYDVIFMDIGLPDINGIEVTLEIRRRESNKKQANIIGLTSYLLEDVQKKCIAAGMNEVLIKPIEQDQLEKLLQRYC